jgi:hypothetical protein
MADIKEVSVGDVEALGRQFRPLQAPRNLP